MKYIVEITVGTDIEAAFEAKKNEAIKDFAEKKKLLADLEKVFAEHKVENQVAALKSVGIIKDTSESSEDTEKTTRKRLTEDQFDQIKKLEAEGMNANQISKQVGKSPPLIGKVLQFEGPFSSFYGSKKTAKKKVAKKVAKKK